MYIQITITIRMVYSFFLCINWILESSKPYLINGNLNKWLLECLRTKKFATKLSKIVFPLTIIEVVEREIQKFCIYGVRNTVFEVCEW